NVIRRQKKLTETTNETFTAPTQVIAPPQNGNSGVEKTSANGGLGEGTLKELRNYTVNEQTHDEPQPDTSSNNNMKYHQENSQELADDIADEPAAINEINNIGESHKVVSLTDTHGCPRVYDVPV
nr:hypothetical protein [Tanacetum cinerariifolium]